MFRGINSPFSTSVTRRVTLVNNPMKSHEGENEDRFEILTNGIYLWLFMTQIFCEWLVPTDLFYI